MAVPQTLTELDGAEWMGDVEPLPPPPDCAEPDLWRKMHPGGVACGILVQQGQVYPLHPHFAEDGGGCTQVLHVAQNMLVVTTDDGAVLPLGPGMWHGLEPGRMHELSAPQGDAIAFCSARSTA